MREVNYQCPLCEAELQSRNQKKPNQKHFQIAHIYPNRPTVTQYEALRGVERLGTSTEDFANKIALCLNCHPEQDFQTTKADYIRLLNIKKDLLLKEGLHDALSMLSSEDKLAALIESICSNQFHPWLSEELNYSPVPIAKKFSRNDSLLVAKIQGYINLYYTYIRDCFEQWDGKDGFSFNILSHEVKIAFMKLDNVSQPSEMNKTMVFTVLVERIYNWAKSKTLSNSTEACEAVVSFFIQHCEVFYEISK